MANQTRDNIKRKRLVKKRQRRLRFFRLLFLLVVFGLIFSAIIFVGFSAYQWASHIYQEYQTMYNDYANRKEAQRGAVDPRFDGYTNVLVLGIDDGVNYENTDEKQADTIMLISLENDTGRVRFITIPRDTWAGEARLSSLYASGGAPLLVRQISMMLGVSIHQYIVLDMSTFTDLIDILGGIDIYVETDMDYDDPASSLSIHLKRGYQHLNGEEAQKYLRYRTTELKDVGRHKRQQKFVKALYEKILQLETIPKLPAIADIFQHRMTTSAEIFDSAHLANVLRKLSSDPPQTIMLPGSPAQDDDTIWVPDQAAIDEKIHELFPMIDTDMNEEE